MARDATETIRVTPENWKRLNSLKEPGEAFDDVITRLIEEDQEGEEGNQRATTGTTTATAD